MSSDSFIRASWASSIRDTYLSVCIWVIWAICVQVNEAHSQVMGQKPRQSYHSLSEKKKLISSASLSFPLFVVVHYHILTNVRLCHPYGGTRASFLSVDLFGCQLSVLLTFISQLSTWIFIFIYTDPFGWTSWADCLNSILAEEKIKAAVFEDWLSSKPVVSIING